MHGLRSFYYKNKYKVWGVIIFIVLLILCIQFMNKMASNSNKTNNNTSNSNKISNTSTNTNTYINTDKSVITGNVVNSNKLEQAQKVIEDFISECNNGNIENAYNLISEDCKKELYPNIEEFKSLYYNSIFGDGKRKMATIENWFSNTYKISITEDILATGKISDKKIEDFITIVKDGQDFKLNINEFVGREKIEKTQTIDNITFKIVEKNIYMNYEEYVIQVENRTENTILLDTQKSTKSIYLTDDNNVKYYSYSHELQESLLKINNGFATQLKIKFFKGYSSNSKEAKNMVFSDVVLDAQNVESSGKKISISI